jgi:cytochrome c oxidase subunit II
VPLPLLAVLTGCSGPQSTLDAAGREAADIAALFAWMTTAAAVIWLAVVGLMWYCARAPRDPHAARHSQWLIVGGGVALPTVLLLVVLGFSLPPILELVDARAPGAAQIEVAGERWWWRVRYLSPDGTAIDLANELRLPVGEATTVKLASDNVIHSFWIPALAGKIDMIPGRTTYLRLEPLRAGTFRGACAEFCGAAHAMMAFPVSVLARADFDRWLAEQAQPAKVPATDVERRGRDAFVRVGCGACHTIRGVVARSHIGPDLTHVASRRALAADTLPNGEVALERWIAHPGRIKPDAQMPSFEMLGAADIGAISTYLAGLR